METAEAEAELEEVEGEVGEIAAATETGGDERGQEGDFVIETEGRGGEAQAGGAETE